jgi:hypothetical protein
MGTSVDGVVVLHCPNEPNNFVAVIECKTATTDKTVSEARSRLEQAHRLTGKFDSQCFHCNFNDRLFQVLVWDISYRIQVLHHSATTEIKRVLFVVASLRSIIYSCIVTFSESDLSHYISIQQKIEETFNYFTQQNISRNPGFVPSAYGHAIDFDTIQVQRKLAQAVMSNEEILSGKKGPGHEFVPFAISEWNHTKGGQDTASRILSNIKIDFRKLTPRAFIYIRVIMTALMNSHCLIRILKTERKLDEYKSYKQFKLAMNAQASFFDYLFDFNDQWQPSHEILSSISSSSEEYQAAEKMNRPVESSSEQEDRNNMSDTNLQSGQRLRLKHYNISQEKALRLNHNGEDKRCKTMPTKKGSTCILCRTRTTSFCCISKAYLCSQTSRCGSSETCWIKFHTLDYLTKWKKGVTPNGKGRTGWSKSTTPVATTPISHQDTQLEHSNSPLALRDQEALSLLTLLQSPPSNPSSPNLLQCESDLQMLNHRYPTLPHETIQLQSFESLNAIRATSQPLASNSARCTAAEPPTHLSLHSFASSSVRNVSTSTGENPTNNEGFVL